MIRVLLLVVVASCDVSLHRMQESVACQPQQACGVEPARGTVSMETGVAPPPLTRALLVRGRDRFERICAACHGVRGDGDSQVARAMELRRPRSLLDDEIVEMSDERLLSTIVGGYGVMPAYGSMIAASDRHAIVHYIRVLQHREIALDELTTEQQQEARAWLH